MCVQVAKEKAKWGKANRGVSTCTSNRSRAKGVLKITVLAVQKRAGQRKRGAREQTTTGFDHLAGHKIKTRRVKVKAEVHSVVTEGNNNNGKMIPRLVQEDGGEDRPLPSNFEGARGTWVRCSSPSDHLWRHLTL